MTASDDKSIEAPLLCSKEPTANARPARDLESASAHASLVRTTALVSTPSSQTKDQSANHFEGSCRKPIAFALAGLNTFFSLGFSYVVFVDPGYKGGSGHPDRPIIACAALVWLWGMIQAWEGYRTKNYRETVRRSIFLPCITVGTILLGPVGALLGIIVSATFLYAWPDAMVMHKDPVDSVPVGVCEVHIALQATTI